MENKHKRTFQGTVVSDKMEKTIVVKVVESRMHPKYQKRYQVRRKFKVHDQKNEYHVGDTVMFEEVRPLSREKRWRAIKKVNS
ncbi:MAG: 30S ribosomal protein S17 [Patescibacteria group bacterium]|nr:30S ribosomal protein S17 [Patescibacteria group bacterium]MDD5715366.1 30S ribosomal protein S17 [Patescibacteria group bacterium]